MNNEPSPRPRDIHGQFAYDSMSGFGKGLRDALIADPAENGLHVAETLPRPVKDSFGEFNTKYHYEAGCTLPQELSRGVGEIMFTLAPFEASEDERLVMVGPTPDQFDPARHGTAIPSGGEVGPYLMAVVARDKNGVARPNSQLFRYLDESDLAGVVVKKGQMVGAQGHFGTNPDRGPQGRQLWLDGRVEKVIGLTNR